MARSIVSFKILFGVKKGISLTLQRTVLNAMNVLVGLEMPMFFQIQPSTIWMSMPSTVSS